MDGRQKQITTFCEGRMQEEDIDFVESYIPTVTLSSVRLWLHLLVIKILVFGILKLSRLSFSLSWRKAGLSWVGVWLGANATLLGNFKP